MLRKIGVFPGNNVKLIKNRIEEIQYGFYALVHNLTKM